MAVRSSTTVTAQDAAEILPCFAMLEYPSNLGRVIGWIVETEEGGAQFLEVQMPPGRDRLLVNARQVRTITVLSEETAVRFAPSAWRTT